jgi:hypothetical protein
MVPPTPNDRAPGPSTPAREAQEAPRNLPPYPAVDSSRRLRTTMIVLIVIAAIIIIALLWARA